MEDKHIVKVTVEVNGIVTQERTFMDAPSRVIEIVEVGVEQLVEDVMMES